jgi:hypothetical protein
MTENTVNTYQTTLNNGGTLTSGATSMVVTSATGAPAANFRVKIDTEYILVTAVAGTTFTITRGIESTTAASHADGALVTAVLTAGGLTQFRNDVLPTAPQRVIIGSNDVTIASNTIATVHSSLDITFTAPSSGRVMFVGGGVVKATALSDVIFFIQLDSGSDNPMGAHEFDASAVPVSIPIGYVHTGLTPGQSYVAHYRWRRDGTGTLSITAGARGGAQQGTWWMCIPLP